MKFFTGKKFINRNLYKISLLTILFIPFYFISYTQAPVRSKLAIQLLVNTNGGSENTADGVVAFFADNFSFAVGNEDSYKFTNLDENLAINSKGTLLSIEGRPSIHGSDTLNLAIWTFRQKSYYLKLNANNFSSATKAFVKDNYLHQRTAVDLSSGTLLPFAITDDSASYAANRFAVIFKTKRVMPESSAAKFNTVFKDNLSLSVYPATGNTIKLKMNNMKRGRYEVSLYNDSDERIYSGFVVHNANSNSAAKRIDIDRRIPKGTYSLLLTNRNVTIKKSVLFQ